MQQRTYDHGVQSSTGKAGGADKALGRLEEGGEIGLVVESAIRLGRAVVEALLDSRRKGKGGREGEDGRDTHFVDRNAEANGGEARVKEVRRDQLKYRFYGVNDSWVEKKRREEKKKCCPVVLTDSMEVMNECVGDGWRGEKERRRRGIWEALMKFIVASPRAANGLRNRGRARRLLVLVSFFSAGTELFPERTSSAALSQCGANDAAQLEEQGSTADGGWWKAFALAGAGLVPALPG